MELFAPRKLGESDDFTHLRVIVILFNGWYNLGRFGPYCPDFGRFRPRLSGFGHVLPHIGKLAI